MASNGRIWRVKVKNAIGDYVTFAGVKEESMTHANRAIDVTDKESDGYRHQIENGGRSVDFSCSGVAIDNQGYRIIKRAVRDNAFVDVLMESEYDRLLGRFSISNYSEDAGHEGAVNFTCALQSANAYTYQIPLNIVEEGVPDSTVTFTRASTGTYFGSDGLLKTAAVGEPRIEYDPATGQVLGLLIEEQRTNDMPYSAELDNAAWQKTGVTVSANDTASPSGAIDADKIVESAASEPHDIRQSRPFTSGKTYTFSLFVKAAGRTQVGLFLGTGATNWDVFSSTWDLSAGTASAPSADIQDVDDGWYRVSFTATMTGTTQSYAVIWQVFNAGSSNYLGDGVSGVYMWGAQVEQGAFPTSYIPTAGSGVTRSADYATSADTGFLNNSEFTIVADVSFANVPGSEAYAVEVYNSSEAFDAVVRVRRQNDGRWYLVIRIDGIVYAQTAGAITDAARIAVALDGVNARLSVNGSAVQSMAAPIPEGLDSVAIGRRELTPRNYLNGTQKEITYYPRALSDERLQELSTL